jgi:hypothetical protein
MKTRRSFIKQTMSAIAALVVMGPALIERQPEFPDEENGIELKHIYRNGKRVRMRQLECGDIFEVRFISSDFDSKRELYRAVSNAYTTELNGVKIWSITVEGVLKHCS